MLNSEERSAALDSLAMIAAAHNGHGEAAIVMMESYGLSPEQMMLVSALLGSTVAILRIAGSLTEADLPYNADRALAACIQYARDTA